MCNFRNGIYQGSPTLILLNVLTVLNVLNMPKDPSLACWALFFKYRGKQGSAGQWCVLKHIQIIKHTQHTKHIQQCQSWPPDGLQKENHMFLAFEKGQVTNGQTQRTAHTAHWWIDKPYTMNLKLIEIMECDGMEVSALDKTEGKNFCYPSVLNIRSATSKNVGQFLLVELVGQAGWSKRDAITSNIYFPSLNQIR